MNNIISFKGVTNAAMGVYVTTMPNTPTPEEKGFAEPIPGRSGTVWKSQGAWEPITLTFPIWVPQSKVGTLSAIKAWLSGSGALRIGSSTDWYYDARVTGGADFTPLDLNDGYTASVTFECYPFRYADAASQMTFTSAGTIVNPYNAFSEPLLEIAASGDVSITIGDTTFDLETVTGTIYVDTYEQECYTSSGLANNMMTGSFPRLEPGANAISWTGTVTSVKVTPRWRAL